VSAVPQEQDRAGLEQRFADRSLELLRPELERIEERRDQDLANRGIPEGSEQFIDIQDRYGRYRGDLLSSIAGDAITSADALSGQRFGRDLTRRALERQDVTDSFAYDNMLRQGELGERQALRQQAQNELVSMLTGQMLQAPILGNFVQPGQVDVLGPYAMQQQAAQHAAGIRSQDRAATLGALGNVGAAAAPFAFGCDYRIKENIEELADGALDKVNSLKLKTYQYREGYGMDTKPTVGFLAHELQEVLPEFVRGEKDGASVQMVDFIGVVATLTKAVQELSDKVSKLERTN
tara:strand:+ start:93 stop:971 length:879 start_codon:yes stop_codon:yes gene_type:complete